MGTAKFLHPDPGNPAAFAAFSVRAASLTGPKRYNCGRWMPTSVARTHPAVDRRGKFPVKYT